MTEEFWRSALAQWQALIPEARLAIRAVVTIVVTFVVARVAGWLTDRWLRAAHFDALFRRPWLPPPTGGLAPHRPTPTSLLTLLVKLTVWCGGVWAFAYLSDQMDAASSMRWFLGRVWAIVATILAAVYLSRLFTGKLVEVLQSSPLKEKLDAWQSPAAMRESRVGGPVVVAGFVADLVVVLLVLLVAADLTNLTLAGQALQAAWQVFLHLFTAAVALLIGWLGARAVRAQTTTDVIPASSAARFAAYTAVSVMAGAALLAILFLAGNFPTYFGLILLVVVVMLVWPAQHWLPDIYAGFLLRMQGVKEVRIDDAPFPVATVGLVQTQLTAPAGPLTWRNRAVLEAHLENRRAAAGEAGPPDGKPG
jgi:hypothetical protein